MIYGDISETKKTHDRFFEKLGKQYGIKELGTWDCKDKKIPLKGGGKTFCASPKETPLLLDYGFKYERDKPRCLTCDLRNYVRFSDFEIGEQRAYYERKTASDFVSSRRDRLYNQLNRMDTFIEGRKGLILEGMPREQVIIRDSKDYFSGYTKRVHDLRGLSPLEQAIVIGGEDSRAWTLSFIRECKMRDIEFVQMWDLDETIVFLEQCDKGFDETPKLRVIPKRHPEITLEQNILVLIPTIGKVNSESLIKKHGSLGKLISDVRKMKKEDMNRTYKALSGVFGYG